MLVSLKEDVAKESRRTRLDDMSIEDVFNSIPIMSPIKMSETNRRTHCTWIQMLRPGTWDHPKYGLVEVTNKTFRKLKENFDNNVRKIDIAIDIVHNEETGAAGWIKKVEVRPDGLWAFVEWTPWGWPSVRDKRYRYISAEFSPKYDDHETGEKFEDVLIAATLTNRPFIKGMAPVLLSEDWMFDEMVAEGYLIRQNNLDDVYSNNVSKRRTRKEEGLEENLEDEEEFEEQVRSIKLKKKIAKGGRKMDPQMELQDIGELETGFELDEEELAQELSEPSIEYDEEDEGEDDEDTQEYDEDEGEDEEEDYTPPRRTRQFSESSGAVDHEARNEIIKLSEKLENEKQKNMRLSEDIKLSAVEEKVYSWVEGDNGKGKIHPSKAKQAINIMMKAPSHIAQQFSEFCDDLPDAYVYEETGSSASPDHQEPDSDVVHKKASEIYKLAEKSGRQMKFGDALKEAYKEVNNIKL